MASLKPFAGSLRKLVLAFDVGTTYSGIAYAILDPGEVPRIQAVTRFPGQENGDFKIPSILYYTEEGLVRAAGAEARVPGIELVVEDEDLTLVEWFKLHLRPSALDSAGLRDADIKPLPHKKTIVEVFGYFLSYLFSCARRYITETHPNGESLWASFGDRIDFVLSHPNGWEGAQQEKMRQAALYAQLVPDTLAGHERIHFVSEGEASLLYCVDNGLAASVIRDGVSVMVIDAGGGTIDISTYKFVKTHPMTVEEIAPANCVLQGSTRVNIRAREFLQERLRDSRYGNDEDLETMMESFEKSAKPTFKDPSDKSFIKFGTSRDKDLSVGIRSGQLALDGRVVAGFFQPSIDAIIVAVRKQLELAVDTVNLGFLVGGFAASPWLYGTLKASLQSFGMDLSRPDSHTNKAVAFGAVSFFLTHSVTARVARLTYGAQCMTEYDASDEEHVLRGSQVVRRPSGKFHVPNYFAAILEKGTRVGENDELRHSFSKEAVDATDLDVISTEVKCYRGSRQNPCWTDLEPHAFETLCTIQADTSSVAKQKQIGSRGIYYTQQVDIVLSCGLTELKAQLAWIENGKEKRGEAKIVYDGVP
ncbi:heat shock protein 70 family protein [Phanerochaete sordida]|uniref:Heat shock protein 70 family protein n=1 Tax=Phanerochaete sordida TaxID=48140 RepID=A0A9P3LHZ0_9APHY|nr:heat shock protein 70 family protein [Phanerochaete sordida]